MIALGSRMLDREVGLGKPAASANARSPAQKTTRAASPDVTKVSMDDKDEIARRLSSLGRVTVKPAS